MCGSYISDVCAGARIIAVRNYPLGYCENVFFENVLFENIIFRLCEDVLFILS
jgi:hypothetical protein